MSDRSPGGSAPRAAMMFSDLVRRLLDLRQSCCSATSRTIVEAGAVVVDARALLDAVEVAPSPRCRVPRAWSRRSRCTSYAIRWSCRSSGAARARGRAELPGRWRSSCRRRSCSTTWPRVPSRVAVLPSVPRLKITTPVAPAASALSALTPEMDAVLHQRDGARRERGEPRRPASGGGVGRGEGRVDPRTQVGRRTTGAGERHRDEVRGVGVLWRSAARLHHGMKPP